jgi:methyl-accepting chemotaxis protein
VPNILALNAAVEAAGAGQAGAEIVDKTIGDVANGVQYVTLAREAFQEVSDRIEQGSEVVSQIAASSETQTRGIRTIGRVISRLETVTQNNVANAQQTAESASAMTSGGENWSTWSVLRTNAA